MGEVLHLDPITHEFSTENETKRKVGGSAWMKSIFLFIIVVNLQR